MINVKQKSKLVVSLLVSMLAILTMGMTVFATSSSEAYSTVAGACIAGEYYHYDGSGDGVSYATNTYTLSEGGYVAYTEITAYVTTGVLINENVFSTLTTGAKQDFLEDFIDVANECLADKEANGVTAETVDMVYNNIQGISGVGSLLMSSLLGDINPDYSTASNILEPFNGLIGVILGILSIAIMSLLGLTMALDIAFIVIPAFQLALGGEGGGQGGGGGGAQSFAKIISAEARAAVSESEGGGGGGAGGGGGRKSGIGLYFKYRWKGLIMLGICLLYLVQGEIYSGVAMIINLLSGFLGF